MKVYLIRNLLSEGIVEGIGHPQTGHPDHIQVTGKGSGRERVFRKNEWFLTYEEAETAALKQLENQELFLIRDEKRIAQTRNQIKKMREILTRKDTNA